MFSSVTQQAQLQQCHAYKETILCLPKICCTRISVHFYCDLVHARQWMHQDSVGLQLGAQLFVNDQLALALIIQFWSILQIKTQAR